MICKIFRYSGGNVGASHSYQRRLIRGGNNHDRFLQTLLLKILFNELSQFATAFADQCYHVNVGFRVAGDHAQQCRFPDT